MITRVFRTLIVLVGLVSFACSPSRFSYYDAYKFGNYNYQKDKTLATNHEQEHFLEPIASTNPDLDPVILERPSIIPIKIPSTVTEQPQKENFKQSFSNLNKKEKKRFKKNLRLELKNTLKEHKALKKQAKNKKTAMNRKVYSGLIVAGAGLIVAILVSGTIGGLAIIIGVALIAWGLIEEGSI